jgi:ParE toxin of type II toxin-antitoxin system, parDE
VKARIIWADPVRDVVLLLPESEQEEILMRVEMLAHFPQMYPVRMKGRRFRRHRWFQAGNWLVFYRVIDNTVYIRGLWPSHIS